MSQDTILREVGAERSRQDARWGGASHDDHHDAEDWTGFIVQHACNATVAARFGDRAEYRTEILQIAALAVAALESVERQADRRVCAPWSALSTEIQERYTAIATAVEAAVRAEQRARFSRAQRPALEAGARAAAVYLSTEERDRVMSPVGARKILATAISLAMLAALESFEQVS